MRSPYSLAALFGGVQRLKKENSYPTITTSSGQPAPLLPARCPWVKKKDGSSPFLTCRYQADGDETSTSSRPQQLDVDCISGGDGYGFLAQLLSAEPHHPHSEQGNAYAAAVLWLSMLEGAGLIRGDHQLLYIQ